MAAINFPSGATPGQIHSENGKTWTYDGVSWISTPDKTNSITLGTDTVGQYAQNITTSGNGISVTVANANDGTQYIIFSSATSDNTNESLVYRSNTGNFSATGISLTEFISIGSTLYLENSGYSIGLVSPNLSNSYTYILPSTTPQGSGTSVLTSNTNGVLSWTPMVATGSAGSGTVAYGNLYEIPFYSESGTLITGSSNFTNVGTGISILFNTNSTSSTTGALVIYGGLGVTGNANFGGTVSAITFIGNLTGLATTANYAHISGYGLTSGLATTANYSHRSGYAVTSGLATTSTNIYLNSTNADNTHYLVFSPNSSGSGVALSSDSNLIFNPNNNTLTTDIIIANLTGTATTSRNLIVSGNSASTNDHYLLWSPSNGGSGVAVSSGSNLSYNPNSNTLKIGGIAISSNEISSSSATVNLFQSGTAISIGAGSGTFTLNNSNIIINQNTDSNSITSGALIVNGGVGIGGSIYSSSSNASSISGVVLDNGVITSGFWAGSLITTLYGGVGLNAYNDGDILVAIGNTFVNIGIGISGQVLVVDDSVDNKIRWSDNFVNDNTVELGTKTTGQYSKTILTSGSGLTATDPNGDDGTDYTLYLNSSSNNTGNALVLRNASGNFSANIITATLSGTATTASNIVVQNGSDDSTYYLTFVKPQTGSGVNVHSDSTLQFNPSTNILSANEITATNINGTIKTANQPEITGLGNITSGTWSATAVSTQYGGTGLNSYIKGELLVGLGNTLFKLLPGDDNTILTADSFAAVGVTWKSILSPTFGAFGSTATQTVSASNTTTLINFDTGFESNNVTATGTTTRIYINTTGVYNLQFNARTNLGSGIGASNGEIWFRLDNSNLDNSNALTTLAKQDSDIVMSSSYVRTIVAGSYIELAMSSLDSNFQLKTRNSSNGPVIPSIFLSVVPVSSVIAGGGSAISGIAQLNTLTTGSQSFSTGKSGTSFNIQSSGSVHTFNIPDASTSAEGLITTGTQSIAGQKTFTGDIILSSNTNSTNLFSGALKVNGGIAVSETASFGSTITIYAAKSDNHLAFIYDTNKTEGNANFQLRHGNFLKFYASNDTNYIDLKAEPTTSYTITLPQSDGITNDILSRNSSGGLFYTSSAAKINLISSSGSATTYFIPFSSTSSGPSVLESDSSLKYQTDSDTLYSNKLQITSTEFASFFGSTSETRGGLWTGAVYVAGGIAVSRNIIARNQISIGNTTAAGAGRTFIDLFLSENLSSDYIGIAFYDGTQTNNTGARFKISRNTGNAGLFNMAWGLSGNNNPAFAIGPTGSSFTGAQLRFATDNGSNALAVRLLINKGRSDRSDFSFGDGSNGHGVLFIHDRVTSSNTNAGDWTIQASTTTGTGRPGRIIFQAATAGTAAGTDYNALNNIFIISGFGVSITTATSATPNGMGALSVLGGVGISGNAFIGGTTSILSAVQSTSASSGALQVSGGVGIGGSLFVAGTASSISGLIIDKSVITSGSWAGTLITGLYGGTGFNTYTKGDILVGSGSTFIKLAVGSSNNLVLTVDSNSASGLTWSPTAATGLTNLNGLSSTAQTFEIGTAGTDFNIVSSVNTHTFNIPDASATARGFVNTTTQSFAGNKTFTGNLSISGNLTVNGTTTTIDSTTTTLKDPIFVLGAGDGGTHPIIDDNKDRGIEFRYISSGVAKTGFFGFQDTTGYFTFIPDGTNNSEVFAGNSGTAKFDNVIANLTGLATTSSNVSLVSGTANTLHSIVFTSSTSSSGSALSTNTSLLYNPSTDVLYTSGLSVTSSVGAVSSTSGALSVSGGLALASNAIIGGTVYISNMSPASTASDTSNFPTGGALYVAGGLAVSDYMVVGRSVAVGSSSTGVGMPSNIYPAKAEMYGQVSNVYGFRVYAAERNNPTIDLASIIDSDYFGNQQPGLRFNQNGGSGNANGVVFGSSIIPETATGSLAAVISTNNRNLSYIPRLTAIGYSSSTPAGFGASSKSEIYFGPIRSTFSGAAFTSYLYGTDAIGSTFFPDRDSGEFAILSGRSTGSGQNHGIGFYVSDSTAIGSTYNTRNRVLRLLSDKAIVEQTTSSTSTSTGSLVVNGGMGVSGNAFIGGTVTISNTTPSIASNTGALTVSGGVGISGSLYVSGTASSISGLVIDNSIIISGSWAGTTITTLYGGTGLTSIISSNAFLSSNSSGTALTYRSVLPGTGVSVDENIDNITIKTNIGSGTTNYFPIWINDYQLGNSAIAQSYNGTNYEVTVSGHFKANTKSFLIPHPLDPENSLLEHGSLEGPEHGIYLRGRAEGIEKVFVSYPDYWQALSDQNNTILITSRCPYNLYVESDDKFGFAVKRIGAFKLSKKRIAFDYFIISNRNDVKLNLIHSKVR